MSDSGRGEWWLEVRVAASFACNRGGNRVVFGSLLLVRC